MIKRNKEKEFETLQKSHKKQIVIGAIAVCVIGGTLTFATTKAKYRVTQDIPLVRGTVNYKAYDFKIMAMYQQKDGSICTEDSCYDEITERMPETGYTINEDKSYCTIDNINEDTEAVLKTVNGEHIIKNLHKSDKCYIYFDKMKETGGDTILTKIQDSIKITIPTFSNIATEDEGVYETDDPMYGSTVKSYYWRGVATTNHLIFANKCWRIVRINGDKSIRIIYNGPVQTGNTCTGNGANAESVVMGTTDAEKYYATSDGQYNNSSYVGWTYTLGSPRPNNNATATPSNAKTETEKWYDNNIGNNATYRARVADGKFCNDRNVDSAPTSFGSGYVTTWSATGTKFVYAGAKRLWETYAPTLSCSSEDIYTLKVGAITADEVEFAGGKNETNDKYYLYNGQNYWTMSPSGWNGDARVFYVYSGGHLYNANVNGTTFGLRPVINLNTTTTFSSGDGTQNSPYIVN